jgi:Ca-activated chloride channel homolog
MKKALVVLSMLGLLTVWVLSLFGDNIRRLFAMSGDSLSGNDSIVGRYDPALQKKRMMNFGSSEGGYGESTGSAPSGNSHTAVVPNAVTSTVRDHLSTFAIDVDTASYSLARRVLNAGATPVPASVRIEEWVNAFQYELDAPSQLPFSVGVEGAPSPFTAGRTVLKVSLQGKKVKNEDRKPAHLVFLVDTSGSMSGPDRLDLAKESLRILTRNLNPRDTVSLVTYAGNVRDVLAPTSAEDTREILAAIDSLDTAGGTNMGSGLEVAYRHASAMVAPGHVSRVIVLTDGDANIGHVGATAMREAIVEYVKRGVTLTTVGFGMGNYRDNTLEELADKGDGQSLYIDSLAEAQKVFGKQLAGTLEVIAKDVKIQIDFDPKVVSEYRLLGYENRAVRDEDFRDDTVDGGEIGAGHSVTALYELITVPGAQGALGNIFVRGKQPDGVEAFEVKTAISAKSIRPSLAQSSTELRFAAAVAMGADILRGNVAASDWSLAKVSQLAAESANDVPERLEFVALIEKAHKLVQAAGGLAVHRTTNHNNAY